jgi:hypothetical protein
MFAQALKSARKDVTKSDLARSDRLLATALCIVVMVCYVALGAQQIAEAQGRYNSHGALFGNDFVVFWAASSLVHAGNLIDIFNIEAFNAGLLKLLGPIRLPGPDGTPSTLYYPWLYPPPGLFPVLPLGFLPYFFSYGVWCVATAGLFVWVSLGERWRSVTGIALIIAPSTVTCLLAGQNGLITGALLVGGLRLLDARPVLAGILFGLLSFKPHLGILIPVALIAATRWRTFAVAGVTTVGLYGSSVLAFGLESWQAYFAGSTSAHYDALLGDAVGPFLNVSASPFIAARILGGDISVRIAVQVLFTAVAAVAVFAAFRGRVSTDLRNAILLSSFALASPFGYFYDLPAVTMAVFIAYREGLRTGFMHGERLALVAAWLVSVVIVALNKQGVPLGPAVLATLFAYLCIRAFEWSPVRRLAADPQPAGP